MSAPVQTLPAQLAFLERVLQTRPSGKVLVMHIRGPQSEPLALRAHHACFSHVARFCSRYQRVHIHGCGTSAEQIAAWGAAFPFAFFSFNAKVARFDAEQLEGLRSVPLNRLLVETDSPHLPPPGNLTLNTPAYLGEVIQLVARARGEDFATVLRASNYNARQLYGM